jgi:hypothetical protein
MEALRTYVLDKFHSSDTQAKSLYYAKAFLTYLPKRGLTLVMNRLGCSLNCPKP